MISFPSHPSSQKGDPLSPYLFILCGEVLSGLCKKAERNGTLHEIRLARGSPRVNHMLFADDTMIFFQASEESCTSLKKIILHYEEALGQQTNKGNSFLFFSSKTPDDRKAIVKEPLRITDVGGTGKYMGLPEHFRRSKSDLFTSLIDRIKQRAASRSS